MICEMSTTGHTNTHLFSSAPLKYAFTVSEKATANGTASAIPMVSGLGPRDDPNDADAVKDILLRLGTLSARSILLKSGVWRPEGLAVACKTSTMLMNAKNTSNALAVCVKLNSLN